MLNRIQFALVVAVLCAGVVYSDPVPKSSAPAPPKVHAKKPAFCRDLDCPEFDVIKTTKEYETRKYKSSRWISTTKISEDQEAIRSEMFMKLFRYIDGNNEKGQKIAMTSPVTTRIIPAAGPACKSNFTMSFYLAPSDANPPAPSDKDVFFSDMGEMTFHVRSFGGYADGEMWLQEALSLARALTADGVSVEETFHFTAGYDPPYRIFGRHNEVWVQGK